MCRVHEDMSQLRALAVNLSRESGRNVDVIEYGLKVGLYNLGGMFGVAGVGWAAGVLPYALAGYVASGTMRLAGGGGHTTTPVRCIILTSVQFGLVGLIGYHVGPLVAGPPLYGISAGILLFLMYTVLRFAPRDTPNKPISRERGRRLKRWAVIVWAFWAGVIAWAQVAGVSAALVLPVLLGLGVQGQALVPEPQSKQCGGGENR
ncbi:Accessory regulator protein AgrB [Candidatus Desulforudis audaxviator]|nr:Accessory regulator protein AgrB [Candidatus Desulforudis audaxviator]